jgi:crotonobetainyl-CoA:carnitine CoA-transferase CaiB-like acyl-CoA transferase
MMEFGADVIKIDNPNRALGLANMVEVNRGKRSILLDLKTEEGKQVFWRLLEDADVVVQNYRKGKIDKLGLGYDEVRKRKPDIIYASLNAYGHLGPWAERPGHEQLAQAATGMQWRYGGGEGMRPVLQPNAVNDYGTGYMGAYAVALALLHKRRTGQGQHVDTSLAYTAVTLQSPFMYDYEGKVWDEPHGQSVLGDRPLHRAYQANDGWLFLGAADDQLQRLASVEGLSGIDSHNGEALERALEERFTAEPVATWVERLTKADIGAHRVLIDPWEPMNDPWAQERGLSMTREVEGMGTVTTTGPAPRLSRTPVRAGRLPVLPGADAGQILDEVGLGDQYESLLAKGVVAHWRGGAEEPGG